MGCRGCWYAEGGRCYQGSFERDDEGRSDRLASEKCDQHRSKRAVTGRIIPDSVDLVIASESNP